jgi:hypothetical protein
MSWDGLCLLIHIGSVLCLMVRFIEFVSGTVIALVTVFFEVRIFRTC